MLEIVEGPPKCEIQKCEISVILRGLEEVDEIRNNGVNEIKIFSTNDPSTNTKVVNVNELDENASTNQNRSKLKKKQIFYNGCPSIKKTRFL